MIRKLWVAPVVVYVQILNILLGAGGAAGGGGGVAGGGGGGGEIVFPTPPSRFGFGLTSCKP